MLLDFPGSPFNGLLGKNELLGKDLALSYFPAEHTGPPKELTVQLPLAGRLQPKGMAVDFELAPEFPGITDKLSLRDWNPPFPYDNKRIQPIDDTFWKEYRAAPKVVVDLALAQKLFGSRFGQYTSVIVEAEGVDADQTLGAFREKLLANLDPVASGLSWIPLAQQADLRSAGNMDFPVSFWVLVSSCWFPPLASLLFYYASIWKDGWRNGVCVPLLVGPDGELWDAFWPRPSARGWWESLWVHPLRFGIVAYCLFGLKLIGRVADWWASFLLPPRPRHWPLGVLSPWPHSF